MQMGVGSARHLEDLIQRPPDVVRFVPHVGDEKPPMFRHDTVEIDEFTHIGIHAGRIDQAGGHTEGALGQ
jgi:hypothetical protein